MLHKIITKITKAPDYHNTTKQTIPRHQQKIQTDGFLKKYSIIQTLHEKNDRGTYIIKNFYGVKYVLKYKQSCDGQEPFICSILKNNFHPNIISVIDIMKMENSYSIIYEYFDGIDLYDYFTKEGLFDDVKRYLLNEDVVLILKQIIRGLKYLHSHNIIHCDLKLENLLIDKKTKQIKIIDFDLSTVTNSEYIAEHIYGTPRYIAPESYDLHIYSKKSDIWSLGIILFIMITGEYPNTTIVQTNDLMAMYNGICRKNSFKHIDFNLVSDCIISNKYNPKLNVIIRDMLAFQDTKRISIDELEKKIDF